MKILDLYLTQVCNLNCEYCYVDVVKKATSEFPVDGFIEKIDLSQYNHIKFFWWEPLLEWDMICKIVSSVRKKSPKTIFTIVSNGILLNQEKRDWILENKLEIIISVHPWSRKHLIQKVELLKSLWENVGIYIIFNPQDFKIALKDILFFSQAWIKNFCFAPEIYGEWDDTHLKKFHTVLFSLLKYIHIQRMNISWISHDSLKILRGGCEKTVFDYHGKYSPCNRFTSLKKEKGFSYKPIYDSFSQTIALWNDSDRWFYACPIGWYLDKKDEDIFLSAARYQKLNQIFLSFFRELHKGRLSFLSKDLEEIRFNLTQQCNLRCSYCYVDFSNERLDYMDGKNIIDFFIEQAGDVKYISFFGGEPFLEFDNLKKLTEYALQKSQQYWKKVYFTVATNFTLINSERIEFLKKYNFNIHISFNGTNLKNDILRDQSSQLVLKNMNDFLSLKERKERISILFAFRPEDVFSLKENVEYLISLWYSHFLFELIFWKEYTWSKRSIDIAILQLLLLQKKYNHLVFLNTFPEKRYLDINTDGKAGENSLEFFGESIDIVHKKYFHDTISKTFRAHWV